jgi:glutamate-1-semialdehyde 2,1-aminomutase
MAQAHPSIDPAHLTALLAAETATFAAANPLSLERFEECKSTLHNGVPMNWMVRWASPFPLCVDRAVGAKFFDVDGHEYVDFCLGDTGAMTGHSPPATVRAITEQLARGMTTMLPSAHASKVGAELQRRFGLKYWQVAMTATDANRFVIRLCRHLTGRPKVLVHNWCYHGTVDDTFAILGPKGEVVPRPGNTGAPVDPSVTTRVVEFNDVEALEAALAHGDVACVLAEPAMTNIGIIPPALGYHEQLRALTRKYGAYLIIDETHCICEGPGGYTKAHGLEPDFLTVGKPIAGGFPAAAYGFTQAVSDAMDAALNLETADTGGLGGTLAANPVAMAAIHATLTEVLTDAAYERTIALAERFEVGVRAVIAKYNLPWNVVRSGCRVEYVFRPTVPQNGGDAAAFCGGDLDKFVHLYLLNRGILMTPFHAMALMCPDTTEADVDLHTTVFEDAVKLLFPAK